MSGAPRTLYLDNADLSHLAKARGPGGPERIAQQRDELRQMIEDGRVRLLVSFIHLAEMALDDETREGARSWLRKLPDVWCFTTPVEDIFRAELRKEAPRVEATRLTDADLDGLRVPTRLGVAARGSRVAHFMKSLSRGSAVAERLSRRADRRARDDGTKSASDRTLERLLVGDVSEMPSWIRPIAKGFLWGAPKVLEKFAGGRTLDDVSAARKLTPHGLGWVGPFVEPGHWPRPGFVASANAGRAPACALRAAIERREAKDLNRDPASGTHYDVRHVAYAAYCDVATLDATNFDATKKIREALKRPTIFRAASLDAVLGHLRSPKKAA